MDRILGGLTAEQLDQFAQYATQLAGQARAPVTEGHRQESAISAATSAVTQYQNPGDLRDQIGEGSVGTDCNGEKGERKRKRDSNTPKKERAPPSLRDDTVSSENSQDESAPPSPLSAMRFPSRQPNRIGNVPNLSDSLGEYRFEEDAQSGDVLPVRKSRAAKEKAGNEIRELYERTRGYCDETMENSDPAHTRALIPYGTSTVSKDVKLPRLIPQLAPGQDPVLAVRQAFQRVKDDSWDQLSPPEKHIFVYALEPKMELFVGAKQCYRCNERETDFRKPKRPPGMQRIPCLSRGEGRPCISCMLSRAGCSFKLHAELARKATIESSGIFIHGRLSQPRVDHSAFIPDATVLATGDKADTSSPMVAISTSTPSTSNPASASSSSNSASNRGSANPQLNPIISNGQQGDEVARLRKRFLRKMKSSVDFLAETLSGTDPDSGQVATADLIETLEEVSDELSERLEETKRLLDQLRGEQM